MKSSSSYKYAFQLPNSFFQNNRTRFLTKFRDQVKKAEKGLLLFKGAHELFINSTDINYDVKQESFFYYLFGVHEVGFHAIIDVETGKSTLFVDKMDPMYKIWMTVLSPEDYQKKYEQEVRFTEALEDYIKDIKPDTIYLNTGVNSDSKIKTEIPELPWLKNYKIDETTMHDILSEARVIKSEEEIDVMREAARITSEGHIKAMRECKPGLLEGQLSAVFKFNAHYFYNSKFQPYFNIVASGTNSSILHYVEADKTIADGDLILFDCGNEVLGYDSDVTSTFPSNGKFTQKQREIYEAVLDANLAVQKSMKPGVKWPDMHRLAERVLLQHLQKIGIVKEGDIDEMIHHRVPFLFMPHGLGHLLGLDTHDVGGYHHECPPRSDQLGLKNLRTSRELQAGMVITVEPGCYFIDFLLNGSAKLDINIEKYVNVNKAMEYIEVGGVRIEDDVVVRENGIELLNHVPRSVAQIEACMRGEEWEHL